MKGRQQSEPEKNIAMKSGSREYPISDSRNIKVTKRWFSLFLIPAFIIRAAGYAAPGQQGEG